MSPGRPQRKTKNTSNVNFPVFRGGRDLKTRREKKLQLCPKRKRSGTFPLQMRRRIKRRAKSTQQKNGGGGKNSSLRKRKKKLIIGVPAVAVEDPR